MDTPIPLLLLALDGLVEFERWRNGAPADGSTGRPAPEATADATPAAAPAAAATALFGFLREKAGKAG
jgi:hypothetical protein